MTWTATLLDAKDRDSHWKIVVEFTNGVQTANRAYRFSGTTNVELATFIRRKATEFDNTDPVDFTPLIGQSIDVTPPGPSDPPTQVEIDEAAWFADWRSLKQMIELTESIPDMATPQRTAAMNNLRTSLEADWLNSYLGSI